VPESKGLLNEQLDFLYVGRVSIRSPRTIALEAKRQVFLHQGFDCGSEETMTYQALLCLAHNAIDRIIQSVLIYDPVYVAACRSSFDVPVRYM
jgi:hypothetical protein